MIEGFLETMKKEWTWADYLCGTDNKWTSEKLKAKLGQAESWLKG